MKIYAEVLHIPYLDNLARAFPEHQFITTSWGPLRDRPRNVQVVDHHEFQGKPVDIVIDSLSTFENFDRPCQVKVKLLHMARGMNSDYDAAFIPECLIRSDAVVSVSEHKRWTFMESARRVVVIPFGLVDVHVGNPLPGRVGTVHLNMNWQQELVWERVLRRYPDAQLIGAGNRHPAFVPKTYREFDQRFSELDVFVHTVVGNSVGLTFAEAMMRGIPVVTGMNLDLPKELVDGWNCMITQGHAAHCLDELADKVSFLVNNRKTRQQMGVAARETARRIWGLDTFRQRWNSVFHKQLSAL